MNTNSRGDLSEVVAMSSALAQGFAIAVPHGHGRPFDLLVESLDGSWAKVQVKTILMRRGQLYTPCCRSKQVTNQPRNRKYQTGDFDILAGVHPVNHTVWLHRFSTMAGKTQISCKHGYLSWRDVL